VELRLIDDGDPGVVAALDRGHRQIDHILQGRLRRRLCLQGSGYLSDGLRKAAVHLVLHHMTSSGRTWSVRMLGLALPHLLVQPRRAGLLLG
jgi:hypothetical protein